MTASRDIPVPTAIADDVIDRFVTSVVTQGRDLYRDLPWRRTRDPYAVLVSEIMLQQTQVPRVLVRYEDWLGDFPTLDALAAAPLEAVLVAWQGLGYNRRAIALKRAAEQVVEARDQSAGRDAPAQLPSDESALRALSGVGPATAAGVRAFAFDLPGVYLETNVRTVVLHEVFAERDAVSDKEITPVLTAALAAAGRRGVGPREWYYALLDYGAHLKRTVPNPSRRSAHHTRQSTFEGSVRQKRAWLLRAVMAAPGQSADSYAADLAAAELSSGREAPEPGVVLGILEALEREGFLRDDGGTWSVR